MAPAGALQPQYLPARRPATIASTPARRFACRGDAPLCACCAGAASARTAVPARCRCGAGRPRRTDRTTRLPSRPAGWAADPARRLPLSEDSAAPIAAGIVVHGRPSPSLPPLSLPRTPGAGAAGGRGPRLRAGGSSPSTASAKIASNTASNAVRSSALFTNVRRAAQYRAVRDCGAMWRIAWTRVAGPSADTTTPPPRSLATNATANADTSTPRSNEWRRHYLRCNAFRAIRRRPSVNTTAAAKNAPKIGGPYFFSAPPPASSRRSMGSDAGCCGVVTGVGTSPLLTGSASALSARAWPRATRRTGRAASRKPVAACCCRTGRACRRPSDRCRR